MNYTFQFRDVWDAWPEFLDGALFTLWLSGVSMAISLVAAVFGALARTSGPAWLRALVSGYVELIRNTPFLIQIFLLFFGLPTIGIRLDANEGALVAMVLNGTAYTIEIVRAGIQAIGHGQLEAGRALGLHRFRVFRLVVLPQALRVVAAPLGSQFILLMLNSSIVSVIAADDLTAAGQDVAGRTFRSFETFFVITLVYLCLSVCFRMLFVGLEHAAFGRLKAVR